tara:strand:- start:709 stop:927 length:219 start_codon:yes stop_codon:yes gene_type:complete
MAPVLQWAAVNMKGESRSRAKSNDDHGYAITDGNRPGPLRTAGGFKYFFNLFFLGLTMIVGFDKMKNNKGVI